MPAVAAAYRAEPRLPPGPPPDPVPPRAAPGRPDGRSGAGTEPGGAAARPGPRASDPEARARLAERLERYRRPAPPEPDPPSLADGLEAAERPAFAALCRAFAARLDPADCGERLLVEAIAACHFRRARLDAIEARLTRALLDGRPADGLPSLPALARVRSALEKEQRTLERDLQRLYALRPEPIRYPGLNPVRLRWLAERIEEGRLRAWSPPEPSEEPSADGAPEPATEPAPPEGSVPPAEPAASARHTAPEPDGAPAGDAPARARSAAPGDPQPGPTVPSGAVAAAAPIPGGAAERAAGAPAYAPGEGDPPLSAAEARAGGCGSGAAAGGSAGASGTVPSSQRANTTTGSCR